jgi:RNA polymerase sigma factor (sigma-70 family)
MEPFSNQEKPFHALTSLMSSMHHPYSGRTTTLTNRTETLVQAAQRGDESAFYALMQEHQAKLYRIAFAYLSSESDALEAIQETTCRAYMQLRKLKDSRHFGTWLIRILMNYCIDEQKRRKRARTDTPTIADKHASALSAWNPDESAQLRSIMMTALVKELEPRYRQVIQLKYYHDMTITDIARAMGRPVGTIKTWLNKALQCLRLRLEKEGDIDA